MKTTMVYSALVTFTISLCWTETAAAEDGLLFRIADDDPNRNSDVVSFVAFCPGDGQTVAAAFGEQVIPGKRAGVGVVKLWDATRNEPVADKGVDASGGSRWNQNGRTLGRRCVTPVDRGQTMPFPDAEHAVVTREKVCDYLLNPSRPVGGPKAAWFASLGYTLANWHDLIDDLLKIARTCDDFVAKPSRFGVKYEATGWIGRTGHRPATVVTIWIVEQNSPPRLITAYPE